MFVWILQDLTQLLFKSSDLLKYRDNNNLFYTAMTNMQQFIHQNTTTVLLHLDKKRFNF